MPSYKRVYQALCTGLMLFALGGCKSEGPAEKAGKQLDEAVDDLTKSKGPAERAGESIDKAAERAGEAIDEAGKKVRKSTE